MSKQDLKNYDVIFLSPHMDDAIFSCGGLISKFKKQNKKMAIINIFSLVKEQTKITKDINYELKKAEINSTKKLFESRKKDEQKIAKTLKLDIFFLDYIDGLYRKDSNHEFIYHSYEKLFSGKINSNDKKLIAALTKELDLIFKNSKKSVMILGPIASGKHIDHLITKNLVTDLNQKYKKNVIFWDDIPYTNNIDQKNNLFKIKKIVSLNHHEAIAKINLCKLYKNQFIHAEKVAFSSINFYKEVFYQL